MLAALTSSELKMMDSIRESIENENISWGEIVWLQSHQEEVKVFGDELLAQWAGISEEEWFETQEKIESSM